MRPGHFLSVLTVLPSSIVYCQSPVTSSKRGLVYVPSQEHPQDDANWDSPTSDLTWYYNYASKPSPAFANFPKLQFVPMLWGTGNSSTFLSDVQSQIKAGANITYVLGFNEPDGDSSSGGSDIPAGTAAQIWKQQIEPLAKQGVKLGAPACTGAESGRQWTQDFFTACVNCTIDFIPVHVCGLLNTRSLKVLTLKRKLLTAELSGMAIFRGWQAILVSMFSRSTNRYGTYISELFLLSKATLTPKTAQGY